MLSRALSCVVVHCYFWVGRQECVLALSLQGIKQEEVEVVETAAVETAVESRNIVLSFLSYYR